MAAYIILKPIIVGVFSRSLVATKDSIQSVDQKGANFWKDKRRIPNPASED
jgi:hypothetical protein